MPATHVFCIGCDQPILIPFWIASEVLADQDTPHLCDDCFEQITGKVVVYDEL